MISLTDPGTTASEYSVGQAPRPPRVGAPVSVGRAASHMPQLDGLRCFAVLVVIAQHAVFSRHRTFGANGPGVYGVWLFFVLSGFLITGILLQARDAVPGVVPPVLRAFYARRFLRIFPLYYAVLLLGAAVGLGESFRHDFWWHLAYLGNWLMAWRGQWADVPTAPLWSLGVEEQFYLVWPAVVLLVPRRRLPWILGATVGCGVASRLLLVLARPNDGAAMSVLWPSTSNLDPLALGALLAWHRYSYSAPGAVAERERWTRLALRSGAALLVVVLGLSAYGHGVRILLIVETLAAGLVSVWLVDRAATGFPAGSVGARLLDARPVRYLGTISYGMYLLHSPVLWLLREGPLRVALAQRGDVLSGAGLFALATAGTVGIASLSWLAFERPLNDLKRRFPYPRANPPVPATDRAR